MRQASDEEHELERQKPGVKAAETTESQEQSNKVGQSQQPLLGRLPALVAAVIFVGVAIGAAAGLLTLMLYGIERLALGYVESTHESGPFNVPPLSPPSSGGCCAHAAQRCRPSKKP